jgi:hypothetical protein
MEELVAATSPMISSALDGKAPCSFFNFHWEIALLPLLRRSIQIFLNRLPINNRRKTYPAIALPRK